MSFQKLKRTLVKTKTELHKIGRTLRHMSVAEKSMEEAHFSDELTKVDSLTALLAESIHSWEHEVFQENINIEDGNEERHAASPKDMPELIRKQLRLRALYHVRSVFSGINRRLKNIKDEFREEYV